MKKKILIITEYFYPANNSTSFYLTNIAKKLSEDNEVEVICNTNISHYDELNINNIKISRVEEVKLSKNNIFLRILKFLISSIKLSVLASKYINKEKEILAVTNPAFIIIFLAILKKFKGFNYTLLVYDVFPENLKAAKILKEDRFLYKIIKKIYDWSYLKADNLIVIGRDMEKIIQKKTDNKVSTVLIENWCDYNEIIPSEKNINEIIKKFNLENKKVFLFAGNLGRVQGLENMLKAADRVDNIDFILLFIGKGAMLKKIKKHIEISKKENVIYAGSFPMSEQNIFLNACDIAIVSLQDSMNGLGVPSKSYFNMAAEKPILYIGNEDSEIAKVITENDIGWISPNNKIDELADLFNILCENDMDYKEYGKRARKVVKKKYSQEIILNKYMKLYSE